jgi:hypothetical protein
MCVKCNISAKNTWWESYVLCVLMDMDKHDQGNGCLSYLGNALEMQSLASLSFLKHHCDTTNSQ